MLEASISLDSVSLSLQTYRWENKIPTPVRLRQAQFPGNFPVAEQ